MSFIRDTMLVFRRQERLALRQPAWVIIGLTQPILYLALFGPLLKGLPGLAGRGRQRVPLLRARPADPARAVRLHRSWVSPSSRTGGRA